MKPPRPVVRGLQRAYLDCKFTSLDPTYELISLALVVPQGPEFYVEISDTWVVDDCSEFVRRIVLPRLSLDQYGLPLEEAGHRLHAWLAQFEVLDILNDAPHYDWPLLLRLAGPQGLPKHVGARAIPLSERDLLETLEFPHHALEDARIIAGFIELRLFASEQSTR